MSLRDRAKKALSRAVAAANGGGQSGGSGVPITDFSHLNKRVGQQTEDRGITTPKTTELFGRLQAIAKAVAATYDQTTDTSVKNALKNSGLIEEKTIKKNGTDINVTSFNTEN